MEHDNPSKNINPLDILKDADFLWVRKDAQGIFGPGTFQGNINPTSHDSRTIFDRVEEGLRILLDTFGITVLRDLSANVTHLGPYSFGEYSCHPLGVAWNRLMDAKYILLSGQVPEISRELCICFALTDYLDSAQTCANFERLVADLSRKNEPEKYYKAFFEAHIASGFASHGFRTSFVMEGDEKTPDLELVREGRRLMVECKSLDPQRIEMRVMWSNIIKKIVRYANQKEKSYEIHIWAPSRLRSPDTKPILNYLKRLIAKDAEGLFYDPEGITRIALRRLPDNHFDDTAQLGLSRVVGESCLLQIKFEDLEKGFYAPVYIGILEKHEKLMLSAIENNFKKAGKKFKQYQNYTCLVYLEINACSAEELSYKMDLCDFFVRQKLKNHSSISAVVISAYLVTGDPKWPFQQYSNVIINRTARNPLNGEWIYGIDQLLENKIEGNQLSLFLLHETKVLLEHPGMDIPLFSGCDDSYETQMRISLVDNSYFKFEFENSQLGKLVCRKLHHISPDQELLPVIAMVDKEVGIACLIVNSKKQNITYSSEEYASSTLISSEKIARFLTETHRIIEDTQHIGNQYKPYLISSDYDYEKYSRDLVMVKDKLSDALTSVLGLGKRAESVETDTICDGHGSLVVELVDNIRTLLHRNLAVADELENTPNISDYSNLQFENECNLLGTNIFVLLNKAVADERYYWTKLGSLFWASGNILATLVL